MGEVNRSMRNKKFAHRAGLPKRVKDMSKEQLEAALLKKKECNTRALVIVERLLENTVNEDWFLGSLKFINDSHFQDIIEERVILRLCGYPLCHQSLKNIPTQQYRISTKLNKVYDISERKNFCSNQCYKAGKYIKDQLLTSPLWLRDKEEVPVFKLLPLGTSGTGAGEEVDIGQNNNSLKEEVAQLEEEGFTSVAQFAQDSLSKLSKRIDKLEKKERENKRLEEEAIKLDDKTEDSSGKVKKSVQFEEVKIEDDCKTDTKLDQKPDMKHKCTSEETNLSEKDISSGGIGDKEYNDIPLQLSTNAATPTMISNVRNRLDVSMDKETLKSGNICKNKRVQNEETNIHVRNSLELSSSQQPDQNDLHSILKEKQEVELALQKTEKKVKVKNKSGSKPRQKKNVCDIPPVTNSIIHIEKCLHEWFTLDSMCFLFGEEKVKEMVLDKGECINEYYKAVGNTTRDAAMREKYEAICRRLNLVELEENKFDSEARLLKPLPDYTAIREDSKTMEIKVRSFFQGKTAFETPAEIQSDGKEAPTTILPLVDLHAQNALRRRIMLDRLNRILPDLLRTFGMTSRDVTTDLRALLCTFTLAAHNITFKPAEWNLLGLIIIKMLSIRDLRLKMMLDTEQGCKYQTMMLMAFNQDGGYLERLMAWLTDIDNLLQKQPLSKVPGEIQRPFTDL